MAKSSLLDGFAYGVLNELLGFFRTDVILLPSFVFLRGKSHKSRSVRVC